MFVSARRLLKIVMRRKQHRNGEKYEDKNYDY